MAGITAQPSSLKSRDGANGQQQWVMPKCGEMPEVSLGMQSGDGRTGRELKLLRCGSAPMTMTLQMIRQPIGIRLSLDEPHPFPLMSGAWIIRK